MASFASFDGLTIAYDEHEPTLAGAVRLAPSVVLLHGLAGDGRACWQATGVVDALLGAGFHVVVPDLRGHGRSGRPHDPRAYGEHALARDVVALAAHLYLAAYAVVGYSLGAGVAARVALLDGRVRRLVLAGVGHRYLERTWDRPARVARALRLGDGGDDPEVTGFVAFARDRGADRLALAGVLEHQPTLSPAAAGSLQVPTLVLCGEHDRVNGDPAALAGAIPGAELAWCGGDHRSAVTDPRFIGQLLAWLAPPRP